MPEMSESHEGTKIVELDELNELDAMKLKQELEESRLGANELPPILFTMAHRPEESNGDVTLEVYYQRKCGSVTFPKSWIKMITDALNSLNSLE